MPLRALQGDAGVTERAGQRPKRDRSMRICIGIEAAKVIPWATGIDESGRIVPDCPVERDPRSNDGPVACPLLVPLS